MDHSRVRAHLCQVLSDIQLEAGEECPELHDGTIPLDHLPGFDSLAGLDAEVRMSEALGIEIQSIPFRKDGKGLSLGEICTELHKLLPSSDQ